MQAGNTISRNAVIRMGKNKIITEEVQGMLETAFLIGCTDKEAVAYVNKRGVKLAESTFYNFIKDNPEFAEKRETLKKNPTLRAKNTVYENLKDVKVAMWYLEKHCSEQFKTRIDTAGVSAEVSPDDIKALRDMLKNED